MPGENTLFDRVLIALTSPQVSDIETVADYQCKYSKKGEKMSPRPR